jgi:hypothetical protein
MSGQASRKACECGHSESDHQGFSARCWHWIHGYRAGIICGCVGWKPVKS